jgi:hypothetical protein
MDAEQSRYRRFANHLNYVDLQNDQGTNADFQMVLDDDEFPDAATVGLFYLPSGPNENLRKRWVPLTRTVWLEHVRLLAGGLPPLFTRRYTVWAGPSA